MRTFGIGNTMARLAPCLALGMALMLAGCASTRIRVSYVQPGGFNLHDVSKIAMVDFNSLPSDRNSGIAAADPRTVGVVQRLVGAAFQAQKLYEIVELGVEPDLCSLREAMASRRCDGVMYGRVWWQANAELQGQYPAVMRLQTWKNLYRPDGHGGEVFWCRRLWRLRDALVWPAYRSQTATLMLSLVVCRLDSQGGLHKISDTFACADGDFLVNNGEFSYRLQGHVSGGPDGEEHVTRTAGLFSDPQHAEASWFRWRGTARTVGIPTEEQIKLMLASQLAAFVSRKLIPTERSVVLDADFGDGRLDAMFRAGAYEGARQYALECLSQGLGGDQLEQVPPLGGYGVSGPDSAAGAPAFDLGEYLARRQEYLFALALCEEHAGEWKRAHDTYCFLFGHCPSQRAADGIGRCSRILQAGEDLEWHVIGNLRESRRRAELNREPGAASGK